MLTNAEAQALLRRYEINELHRAANESELKAFAQLVAAGATSGQIDAVLAPWFAAMKSGKLNASSLANADPVALRAELSKVGWVPAQSAAAPARSNTTIFLLLGVVAAFFLYKKYGKK